MLTTILTFNYFDMIWVLTRGGPQNATHIFPTKIYELGFGQFRFGEAAAYGVDLDPGAGAADRALLLAAAVPRREARGMSAGVLRRRAALLVLQIAARGRDPAARSSGWSRYR